MLGKPLVNIILIAFGFPLWKLVLALTAILFSVTLISDWNEEHGQKSILLRNSLLLLLG